MDESCREAQRNKRGNPGRSSQRGRKRAENPIAIVSARLPIRFDLEERKAVPIPESYKEAIRAFEGDALEA